MFEVYLALARRRRNQQAHSQPRLLFYDPDGTVTIDIRVGTDGAMRDCCRCHRPNVGEGGQPALKTPNSSKCERRLLR